VPLKKKKEVLFMPDATKGHGTQKNLSSKEINSFDLLLFMFRLKFLTVIG